MITKRLLMVSMGLSLAVVMLWPSLLAGKPSVVIPDTPPVVAAIEAPRTEAQQRWHAVVGFWNNTDRATILYYFRWGEGAEQSFTLRPGERRWHSWRFATPDQATWPAGYVRYDVDSRTAHKQWTTVRVHASPALERGYWYGSRYAFSVAPDGYHLQLRRVFDDPVIRD